MHAIIYAGANRLQVTPLLPPEHLRAIRRKLTYVLPNVEFTPAYRLHGWDGSTCLFTKRQNAPIGYIYRVRHILESLGYNVSIEFEHDYAPQGPIEAHGLTLEKFQRMAVKKAAKYRFCIIEAPVRAGKTAISAALINHIGHYPVWVVTQGKDLVRQTKESIELHTQKKVGFFSESAFEENDVVVTSYAALHAAFGVAAANAKRRATKFRNEKILEHLSKTKVLILDECHHAISKKFPKILEKLSNIGYRIGLSATPKPDTKHALEVEAVLGAVASRIKYDTLIKKHRLAQPLVIFYDLPYSWFSNTLYEFADVYEVNVIQNDCRNKFIADVVKRLNDIGKSVFVNICRLDHGPVLQNLIPNSVYIHGSTDANERQQIFKRLQNKDVMCVIATIGKEGMNIPRLDAVVNAEGRKAYTTTRQKMRSLTAAEGKKYGIIIDFYDKGKFLRRQSKKRFNVYSALTGFIIKTKKVPTTYFPMEESRWIRTTPFSRNP